MRRIVTGTQARARALLAGLLVACLAAPVSADPLPNPFPTPPPKVFCFRVTDVEQDAVDPNTFTFEFEFLNWTDQPAHGAYIWTNIGTSATEGTVPQIAGAGIDPDGRGGPRGGSDIGSGIYNSPAHHSGRGRGDIPGHLNDWNLVFAGATSVYWGGAPGSITPIPFRDMMGAVNSAGQYALVPGLGNDGLLVPDSAVDGGPEAYGPPTQAAPFPAGGAPTPNGSGNVLDGFTLTVTDFHEGEVLSMNWILADQNGESIGQVGTSGNVVGNEMGFGLFNLVRVGAGEPLPEGVFAGNSGFIRGTNFYQDVYDIPAGVGAGSINASFGVEFGAALIAPPENDDVATEVPANPGTTIPNIDPAVLPPNTDLQICSNANKGDANLSGHVNVTDLSCMLLVSGWEAAGEPAGQQPGCWTAPRSYIELNCDDSVNVADVMIALNLLWNQPLASSLDANGNGCVDECECSVGICDDNNDCTEESCSFDGECVYTPVVCNDGDPCTTDSCDPAAGCTFSAVDCNGSAECPVFDGDPCDDGDICTAPDTCQSGTCQGSAIDCDDDNPCTTDSCGATGCENTPLTDGTSCGGLNQCIGGNCVSPVGCTSDTDCSALDDDCTMFTCQPVSGQVGVTQCTLTGVVNCDDGNSCTDDSCLASGGCQNVANPANACSDGDPCTLSDACMGATCVGSGFACDDSNQCTTDFCAADTSCYAAPLDGTPCTDGSACTTNLCEVGHCTSASAGCDDSNACTTDSCDGGSGCVFTPITCSDGDLCTADSCDTALGCQFTAITCSGDGVACTDEICNPASGCSSVANAGNCPGDGVACTNTVCDPLLDCQNVPNNGACNDGRSCTTDICNPLTDCEYTFDDSVCNDSIPCTVDTCEGATAPAPTGCTNQANDGACPPPSGPCKTISCSVVSGCIESNLADNTPCDDGNPATTGDICTGGVCMGTGGSGPSGLGSWDADSPNAAVEWDDFWTEVFDTQLGGSQISCAAGFCDIPGGDSVGNVVAYERDVSGSPVTVASQIEMIKWKNSAVWFFWEDSSGGFHDIACGVGSGAMTTSLGLNAAEQVYTFPYTCTTNFTQQQFTEFGTWNFSTSVGADIVKLHLWVLLKDTSGFGAPNAFRLFSFDASSN